MNQSLLRDNFIDLVKNIELTFHLVSGAKE